MANNCTQRDVPGPADESRERAWFSVYTRAPYSGAESPFFDPAEFPWAVTVESATTAIRAELEDYLERNARARPYFRGDMVTDGQWQTIPLMTWGLKYQATLKEFPKTLEAVARIPGIVSVAFNILQPGTRISPHFGDTNTAVRAHLGLRVPAGLPTAGLRVAGRDRAWEEGRWLMFCDGFEHSAWNLGDSPRYILLLDVIRPGFVHRRKEICATVLGSLATQAVLGKAGVRGIPPRLPVKILHPPARLAARALSPAFNALGRYRHGPTALDRVP